jgi:hypothetical protein
LAEFINWRKFDRVSDGTDNPEYTLKQDDRDLFPSTNLDRLLRLYGADGKKVTGAKVSRSEKLEMFSDVNVLHRLCAMWFNNSRPTVEHSRPTSEPLII